MPKWDADYVDELLEKFEQITSGLESRLEDIVEGRVTPDPDKIPIGSARKIDAAVLFFDICGWTHRSSFPDHVSLKRALYVLDALVPMVMHTVHAHGGFVEKNTGDGVMAVIPDMGTVNASQQAL